MLLQSPAQHNADIDRRPQTVCARAIHQLNVVSELPGEFPLDDSKRLCVHLLDKAIASLPEGGETLLGIFDLRGFGNRNADLGFVRFLVRCHMNCCSAILDLSLCMGTCSCASGNSSSLWETRSKA
jgi:hypothetical protein